MSRRNVGKSSSEGGSTTSHTTHTKGRRRLETTKSTDKNVAETTLRKTTQREGCWSVTECRNREANAQGRN
jgi:hypothetical protein